MIAHDGLDDPTTARIARWLPEFRDLPAEGDDWDRAWLDLIATSAELPPTDDAAIIRDNRPHGYPTQSLLYCLADVSADGVDLRGENLTAPGHWG